MCSDPVVVLVLVMKRPHKQDMGVEEHQCVQVCKVVLWMVRLLCLLGGPARWWGSR